MKPDFAAKFGVSVDRLVKGFEDFGQAAGQAASQVAKWGDFYRSLQRRGKPVIESPQVGDVVTLRPGFSGTDSERGRIVQIDEDLEEGICVLILDKIGFQTRQWCSPWELERVDVVTRLGEIDGS